MNVDLTILAGLTADKIRRMEDWQAVEVLNALTDLLDEVNAALLELEVVPGFAAPGFLCAWHDGIESLRDDEVLPLLRIAQERFDALAQDDEVRERRTDYHALLGVKTGAR